MGKKLKRGQQGNVVKYVTRTTAIKRLQLRLAEFRRLCILKGIHPREPKKKVKGQNKTYYHVKDINFLAHEPILQSFRDIKAYAKKVKKARAKKNFELARQLEKRAPGYKLDHLVRERYPTFVDALRDLDDALCMVHLFATLPADEKHAIPVSMVNMSRRLVLEWQAYCCRTSAVRKAFISVKGFYFQVLPKDVDYRVMLTFLEFYTTLLQFVHFKLYHALGFSYPPSVKPELAKASAELAAIMRELGGAQEEGIAKREAAALSVAEMKARAETLPETLRIEPAPVTSDGSAPEVDIYGAEDEDDEDEDDDEALVIDSGSDDDEDEGNASDAGDPDDAEIDRVLRMRPAVAEDDEDDGDDKDDDDGVRAAGGAIASSSEDDEVCASLFKGLVVWLAREVPREPLMLLVRSFGGIACWDGVGSPYKEGDEAITHQVVDRPVQGHVHMGRDYVQPQWVFDCANFRILVPTDEYAPGKKPPPHLSPFLDYAEEGYVPDYAKSLLKLQESANAARRRAMGVELEGGEEAFVGDAVEDSTAPELQEDAAEELYHEELAKELGPSQIAVKRGAKRAPDVETEELEDVQKKALMTRKQRKMFEGLRKKEAEKADRIAELEAKKANIKMKKQVAA